MSLTLAVKPTIVDRVVPNSLAADIALVIGGASLTALAAQLQFMVPGNPVPFTFQTMAVLLTGAALGSTRGAISMALYALAGLILPVYSQGSQGISVLLGATGGYIFGFIVAAALVGFLAERKFSSNVLKMFVAYVLGSAVIYAVGVPVLAVVAAGGNFSKALEWGLYPFLAWDAVKAVVAGGLLPSAWALVRKIKGN
jgi:biotin transport system substrate-specific component